MKGRAKGELEVKPAALLGQRVAFTGRFAAFSRGLARSAVHAAAGRYSATVTSRVTMLVVGSRGWPLLTSGRVPADLSRAQSLQSKGGRIRIVSEDQFLEILGAAPARPHARKSLALEHVAATLGVDAEKIRRWEHLGLVRSVDGRYDFQDLVTLQTITSLVSREVSPVVIRKSLDCLCKLLPDVDRPLSQLNVLIGDRGDLVAELGEALLTQSGQLEMRFGSRAPAASEAPRLINDAPEAGAAGDWIDRGLMHESAGEPEEAAHAYRQAAALAPENSTPHFNLGNLSLAAGRMGAAIECFRRAVSLDPGHARAWFNLAHAQDARGLLSEALESLRRSVAADPAFADAHFNLADVAERVGQGELSQRAWKEYLRLDPSGEWAGEARRRLRGPGGRAWR